MRLTLEFNGKIYSDFDENELLEAGVSQKEIDVAIAKHKKLKTRTAIRSQIASEVGDVESLLGVTADASGALVALGLARLAALVNTKAADLSVVEKAELATIKAIVGDVDLKKMTSDALSQIRSGDAALTVSAKGIEAVIADVLERSTGVVNILKEVAA